MAHDPQSGIDTSPGGGKPVLSEAELPCPGDIVEGRYQIDSKIGSGGMGHVFAARHTTLGRRVALKVLSPELARSPTHTERFLREAKAASTIEHPCIVELTDFGHTASGCPFFAMEHLDGETLAERLRGHGPLRWSLLGPLALQICGALETAHDAGVIHRDIKPENLFVIRGTTHVKVLDFGIAKTLTNDGVSKTLTDSGAVLGTTDYLSPEAIRGTPIDKRADIYSLGISLYQLISGRLPYVGKSKVETMVAHLNDTPAPLPDTVAPSIAAVIERCIQKDPDARYASARALFDAITSLLPNDGTAVLEALSRAKMNTALETASTGLQLAPALGESGASKSQLTTSIPGPSSRSKSDTPRSSRRWAWLIGAAAVLGLAAGAAVMFASARSSTIDPDHLASFGALPDVILGPGVVLDDAKIELGRMLFSDVRLSAAEDFACATCHPLDRYGVDGRVVASGHAHKTTGRNVPSVYNAAGHFAQGWSGAAATVEAQARIPILDAREMANTEAGLTTTLQAVPAYRERFASVFPGDTDPITLDNISIALAAFERTLVTPAPWDQYLAGHADALTKAQRRGFNTFVDTGCVQCHAGAYIGATQFQKLGLLRPWPDTKDRGRYEDTEQDADWMMFKVASLRNVIETGPYFHDGSIASLRTAVDMMAQHQLDKELDDDEIDDIVAFLGALTGELPQPG